MTFEDLRRIAEAQNALKPRKAERSWRASWKALDGFFAGMKAIAIDHAKLTEYVAYRLSMHRARGTIRNELAAIRQALKKAALDGKALVPIFPSVEESAPRKGFFEVDAYAALLAQLPEDIQAVISFLRETGWRLNEALSLQWRQVDLGTKIVRLDPGMTKNDEGRTFPFAQLPALDTLLRTQRERTSQAEAATGRLVTRVFHDQGRPIRRQGSIERGGGPQSAAGIYREWPHAETGKRVRGPIPHDFRRTAVRDLIAAGVPDKVAMEITGHKTREVFDRYHIVSETDKTRADREAGRAPGHADEHAIEGGGDRGRSALTTTEESVKKWDLGTNAIRMTETAIMGAAKSESVMAKSAKRLEPTMSLDLKRCRSRRQFHSLRPEPFPFLLTCPVVQRSRPRDGSG